MASTPSVFERDRYVVLTSLLQEASLTQIYRYACTITDKGRLDAGDHQVPGTPCSYGDFIMDGLLNSLLPQIEQASGLRLFPTYSYFRMYKHGDTLARHTDRPSCEISVTLCLGFEGDTSWPVCIEGPSGTSSVNLRAGDGLLYRGRECPHWRDKFEGTRQAQVFLHYVDQEGPCVEWKLDKRPSTARLNPVLGA